MTEMVERVARAIAADKRKLRPSDPVIDRVWSSYVGQARAAIAAMREPTEEMIAAGIAGAEYKIEAVVTWQYMIDAALKDGE